MALPRAKIHPHAQTWFGVCVRPKDQALRFGLSLNFPWEQNDAMDALTKNMGKPGKLSTLLREAASAKVGRNDPCPCGSGKKYKKCCLT